MSKTKNKEFARILLPIDGSEPSMKAGDYAIAVARRKGENNNAELIALHVIHSEIKHVYSTYSFGGSINQNSIDGIIEDAKKKAQRWFDKVQEEADENNIKLRREITVNSRSVVGAVVDYAEHEGVDLIVIGSRGLSGFNKLLLGSTASGVITYAHCPVLVVK
ncbi:MAG TPA: universal stress protein [Candidatus Nitrosopolaris sp.]|nr:universal stress protein [Candidatus Nitrosopolaris sp.]